MTPTQVSIDRSNPVPIYVQIRDEVKRLILDGKVTPGEALPSENELSRMCNVSPMTVRQAMSELVNEGYVYRERGKGTFVSPMRLQHQLETLTSFSEDMQQRDMRPSAELLAFDLVSCPAVLSPYVEDKDMLLRRVKRLRIADGQPVGVHDAYLTAHDLDEGALAAGKSLYSLLEAQGVLLTEARETIEAEAATSEVADHLKVPLGSPLLRTTRFSWDDRGEFVEYVVALYHPDLYQYTIRLKRI